jgi:hypothetical protein
MLALLAESSIARNVRPELIQLGVSVDDVLAILDGLRAGTLERHDDPQIMRSLCMFLCGWFVQGQPSDEQWLRLVDLIEQAPLDDVERSFFIDPLADEGAHTANGAAALSQRLLRIAQNTQRAEFLRTSAILRANWVIERCAVNALLRSGGGRLPPQTQQGRAAQAPATQGAVTPQDVLVQAVRSGALRIDPDTRQSLATLAKQKRHLDEALDSWPDLAQGGGLARAVGQLRADRPSVLDRIADCLPKQ